MKISDFFLSENLVFLVVKFSIYLDRRVFLMIVKSLEILSKKIVSSFSFTFLYSTLSIFCIICIHFTIGKNKLTNRIKLFVHR